MPTFFKPIVVVCFLCCLPSNAVAQASFQGVGLGGADSSHASAISDDGTTAVGYIESINTTLAYRWVSGTMTLLGDLPGGEGYCVSCSRASGVSADGSVVVGSSVVAGVSCEEPFLWRDGRMISLGRLETGSCSTVATDVSTDGSVVVGFGAAFLAAPLAFRWTDGVMDAFDRKSLAHALSGNGLVIVGWEGEPQSRSAFHWNAGLLTSLPSPPEGTCGWYEATDVSDDGLVVVGFDGCGHLIRWVNGVGTILQNGSGLDAVSAGGNPFTVKCSSTGTVVVGGDFIWHPTSGLRSLREMLTNNFGLDLNAWQLLQATDVSGDGLVIVGDGVNPAGMNEAWIVRLPADPVAICRDVRKEASADCKAALMPNEVDDGSFDPNGGSLNLTLTPSGPFPLGSHEVNLTAEDGQGLTSTCTVSLTVTGDDPDDDQVCGAYDNCPAVWNADQHDSDTDGVGDACDQCPGFDDRIDTDGDGVIDGCDLCPNNSPGLVVDAFGCPVPFGPCCFDGGICIDGTDGDDCRRVSGSYLGDGLSCDGDPDGDGISGCDDGCPLDPTKVAPGACGCGVPDTDSDHDGTADCVDECPNDPAKTEPGDCGCGVADIDTDGDGVLDCVDPCPLDNPDDSDGDGVCDSADPCPFDDPDDSDGDGVCDSEDGCRDDPNKVDPGVCGCGVPDDDADADGVANCIDLCVNSSPGVPINGCGCEALGACCFSAGVCFGGVEADACASIEGIYQGDGSACAEGCGFGDFDGNGAVGLRDIAVFQQCFGVTDIGGVVDPCGHSDSDRCGTIDLSDFAAFRHALTGP